MRDALLLITALVLFGCGENHPPAGADGKPLIYVSIPPQAGLLKKLAGDRVEIRTLVGEGQSPHAYAPTARHLTSLANADILFTIGVPFEKALLKKIIPLYPDLKVVQAHKDIILREMPHNHHSEHCIHDHGEKDPHVWLSPQHAMTIAENMYVSLENIDPGNAPAYRANYEMLISELKKLHAEIEELLNPFNGNRFYVFHPSFGYFADQYGLTQIPVEVEGKTPSSRQLVDLIEQAKADGVKIIFVQKQFPINSAEAIANAIGGEVVQLDPLAEDSIANLRTIANSIAKAFEQ